MTLPETCRHSTYGLGGDVLSKAQAEKHRAVPITVSNTQTTRAIWWFLISKYG
jgi:hypothetical protein